MHALILALLLAAAPAFGQTGNPALQRCLEGASGPDSRLPAAQRAEALAARATIRLAQRDDRGALADITAAIRLAPDEPEFRFERVRILEEMENLPGAIAELTETLRLFPDAAADVLTYRAALRANIGELAGAVADYTAAWEAGRAAGDPPHYTLLIERANLRLRLGEMQAAVADLLAAAPMQPPTERLIGLCTARARLGEFDAARADCAAARTTAAERYRLPLAAAAIGVELLAGDRAAARRLIVEARRQSPHDAVLAELARAADAPLVGATPFTKRWFEILFGPGARLP